MTKAQQIENLLSIIEQNPGNPDVVLGVVRSIRGVVKEEEPTKKDSRVSLADALELNTVALCICVSGLRKDKSLTLNKPISKYAEERLKSQGYTVQYFPSTVDEHEHTIISWK